MGLQQGCCPEFWRQHQNFCDWVPTGYEPSDYFNDVFGRDVFDGYVTLAEALDLCDGGINGLAREAVAALLNASHPYVAYPLTPTEVINMFQYAFDKLEETALEFAELNRLGCPL